MSDNKMDSPGTQSTPIVGFQGARMTGTSVISNQRRKLIKASAAAVPALMTLSSGAAAAVASSYQCLNHQDTTGIDPVLGDDELDAPHDQWVRMPARPGYFVSYTTGQNAGTRIWNFYGFRKNTPMGYSWNQIEGWDWYGENPNNNNPIELTTPDDILANSNLVNAWSGRTAFYCVSDDPDTGGPPYTCLDENGTTVDPTVDPLVIQNHTTLVQLIAYFNQYTNEITYYPMEQGNNELPITASCMCSIDPTIPPP
jgi:hypothetical protein